jgi:hypothetical protein
LGHSGRRADERKRCLFGAPCPAGPVLAVARELFQRAIEGAPLVGVALHERREVVALFQRGKRERPERAIWRKPERALQTARRLRRAGVHGEIEIEQIDAARQFAAPRVPEIPVIDFADFGG